MIMEIKTTILVFVVLFGIYYTNCSSITGYSNEVSSTRPEPQNHSQFRKEFCKYVCAKDPSLGGSYCDCNEPPISDQSDSKVVQMNSSSKREIEVSSPKLGSGSQLRINFCRYLCRKDIFDGGSYCNCDAPPMADQSDSKVVQMNSSSKRKSLDKSK